MYEGRWQGLPTRQQRKGMIESKTIYMQAFESYKKLGLDPLPIPYENGHPTKGPKIAGWQTKAANGEYTSADFAEPCNIGILRGGTRLWRFFLTLRHPGLPPRRAAGIQGSLVRGQPAGQSGGRAGGHPRSGE